MQALAARPDSYIYPPRSKSVLPRSDTDMLADMGWIAQYKFNDSHLLLKLLPDRVEFWGRKGERLAYRPDAELADEVRAAQDVLGLDRDQYHLLDGGLLDSRHSAIKDTIVLWDILVRDGEQLLGTSYQDRYESLLRPAQALGLGAYTMPHNDTPVGLLLQPHLLVPLSFPADPETAWNSMWQTIEAVNQPYPQPLLEGLVYKLPGGKLEPGFGEQNNGSWMVRSRVTTGRHKF
jgi:hypothetical protein